MDRYHAFAALIYVTDTEEQGVMRIFDWKEKHFEGDRQLYREAEIRRGDKTVLVAAARQPEMGMTAAATLSMKLIGHYRPQYLIMPGIAAGISKARTNEQMYGDVVLATSVWNYSNGKYVVPEKAEILFGNIGFIPRPTVAEMSPDLVEILQDAAKRADCECHVDIGSMASGTAVVANENALTSIRLQQFDTRGLDMEAYGVAYAAKEASEPRPYAVIAKSVCDFADGRKSDKYQKFASYTSCEFTQYLIETILPDRDASRAEES